ncbi:hypothetical protein ACFLXJ_01640 [Chloroflexota bacterium]
MDIKEIRHRVYVRRDALVKSGLSVSDALKQAWSEVKEQDNPTKQIKPPPPTHLKVSEQKISPNASNSVKTAFEDQYPPKNRTEDGHWVRSRAEVNIDNWLYFHGIVHSYEMKLPGTNYRCDFYIPMGKVYIEFWGLDEEKYLATRRHKLEIYNNEKLNLIELFDKDVARLGDVLPDKLREHHVQVL